MKKSDLLKNVPFFSGLSENQLDKIVSACEKFNVAEDEMIFDEGNKGNEIYVLLEGRIQIYVKLNRQTELVPVHTIVPGKVFGEFAMVSDHKRSATAIALKNSVCLSLSRDAIRKLAAVDPELGYILLNNLCEILVSRIIKTTKELRTSLMF